MMSKLQKRLWALWNERTNPIDGPSRPLAQYRYIPRAFSANGTGWGVYDCLEERFLSDKEVLAIPTQRLLTAQTLH